MGGELAAATLGARTAWAVGLYPAAAELGIDALAEAGLPPRLAAQLWLAAGGAAAADPAVCDAWVQLARANVPATQLDSFAAALSADGGAPTPRAAGSLLLLRLLLGSWPAAVQAAAADTSLLALVQWPTDEQQRACLDTAQLELTTSELLQLARLVARRPDGLADSADTLQLLLGSGEAAWRALLADASLARLPYLDDGMKPMCWQLWAAPRTQEQLLSMRCSMLLLARRALEEGADPEDYVSMELALGSLLLLAMLLGSPEAAVEAAAAEESLLLLPYSDVDLQIAFECCGAAGLTQAQRLRLARILSRDDYAEQADRLIWLADELYGGDWRAALLEFLRRWRVYVRCLCDLRPLLDILAAAGLEVANAEGRRRVLEHIKVRPALWPAAVQRWWAFAGGRAWKSATRHLASHLAV